LICSTRFKLVEHLKLVKQRRSRKSTSGLTKELCSSHGFDSFIINEFALQQLDKRQRQAKQAPSFIVFSSFLQSTTFLSPSRRALLKHAKQNIRLQWSLRHSFVRAIAICSLLPVPFPSPSHFLRSSCPIVFMDCDANRMQQKRLVICLFVLFLRCMSTTWTGSAIKTSYRLALIRPSLTLMCDSPKSIVALFRVTFAQTISTHFANLRALFLLPFSVRFVRLI
jgi:hypothetical protein